jgi:hypothetical protein
VDIIKIDENPSFSNSVAATPRAYTYFLSVKSDLPPGWSYSVADQMPSLTLQSGAIRKVPVQINVPPGSPTGQAYHLEVEAWTVEKMFNFAIPQCWSVSRTHNAGHVVAGVLLEAHTLKETKLSLEAKYDKKSGQVITHGNLDAAKEAIVAIDYKLSSGSIITRLVKTDATGDFTDNIVPPQEGISLVRAIWQGDLDHSSAVSDEKPIDGTPVPKPVPEFPSMFLPATMIIGFLGAALLIQRTRGH